MTRRSQCMCGLVGNWVEYIIIRCGFHHQSKTTLMYSREQYRRDLPHKKNLSQENTCVLVQKVQNCQELIYGSLNLISLGGDNILGYCAALVLRARLPNERNGSVTLGEEPKATSSQLQGQPGYGSGASTSLCLIHCTAKCKNISHFFTLKGIASKSNWPTYPQKDIVSL